MLLGVEFTFTLCGEIQFKNVRNSNKNKVDLGMEM